MLYDDDCGFCSAVVRFVQRHTRRGEFRFAPLGSAIGREVLAAHTVDPAIDSIVVIGAGGALVRSSAVLAIVRRLDGPWHLLRIGRLVPRRLADAIYDGVAKRRSGISSSLGLTCGMRR